MVLSKFKDFSNKKLKPLAQKINLTPNKITLIGFSISMLSMAFLLMGRYIPAFFIIPGAEYFKSNMLFYAGLLIIISGFFDALDGVIAREKGMVSKFGAVLDSVLDRYSDALILMGVIIMGLCDPLWGIIAITGSLIVSYSRARAESVGVKEMLSIGIAERPERMLILSISMMVQGGCWGLHCIGITNAVILWIATWLIAVITIPILICLTNFTVIQRIVFAYKELKMKNKEAKSSEEKS